MAKVRARRREIRIHVDIGNHVQWRLGLLLREKPAQKKAQPVTA